MSVLFYAEPLVISRWTGMEKINGEFVEKERESITIDAVVRLADNAAYDSFEEHDRIEGDVSVHSDSELLAPNEQTRGTGDYFVSEGKNYRIVLSTNSKKHGGFWRALARRIV